MLIEQHASAELSLRTFHRADIQTLEALGTTWLAGSLVVLIDCDLSP